MKKWIAELGVLLALALSLNLHASDEENKNATNGLVGNYKRMIVVNKDRKNIESADPTSFMDPHHQRMLTLGFYSQADADKLTQDSKAFFLEYFGIDVTQGFYNSAIDAYLTQDWIYFHVDEGRDDYANLVVFDSENLNRGVNVEWFSNSVGSMIVFLKDGTFTGGVNAGKSYKANDGALYMYYDLLKFDSDWTKKKNREHFLCYTTYTAKQFTNMDGTFDSLIRWESIDSKGNVGRSLMTNAYFERADGTRDEWKRAVLTWE